MCSRPCRSTNLDKAAPNANPGDEAGTSQMVLAPSADNGLDDHTYAVARDADVTQLFEALPPGPVHDELVHDELRLEGLGIGPIRPAPEPKLNVTDTAPRRLQTPQSYQQRPIRHNHNGRLAKCEVTPVVVLSGRGVLRGLVSPPDGLNLIPLER